MELKERKGKRTVQAPSFFKRKMFMAAMMLICSGVLAIVATYAWFILATSPEITGITTTIGANGSLEMALLSDTTYENTTLIQANVGDSLDVDGKSKAEANVTWGNLVDLSDTSYGLSSITMSPSLLNESGGKIDTANLLSIAHNGTDGRITSVSADTATASFNGTTFNTSTSSFGVRAIGKINSGTGTGGRASGFLTAKSSFNSNKTTASSNANSIVTQNITAVMTIVSEDKSSYTVSEVKAAKAIVDGMYNSLNYVFSAYKNAILAAAASVSDEAYNTVKSGIGSTTDVSLSTYATYFDMVGISSSDLADLSSAMSSALSASSAASALLYDSNGDLVDDSKTFEKGQLVAIKNALYSGGSLDTSTYTITGDASNGLITAVAQYTGSYTIAGIGHVNTTVNNGSGLLAKVDFTGLTTPPAATSTTTNTGNTTLTTFYGYIIDLAFRTNTASSLQLQSDSIDRIYTDGSGSTSGAGSKATFNYAEGMTETQVQNMLSGVRVVFFDPDSGTVYGTAGLGTPTIDTAGRTASAQLYLLDSSGSATVAANATLTELEVATPKKISALVYLDGTTIDNMSVINAESSGTLLLNLQFSSSADLIAMEDSELKSGS
jgi:hypothetical protein